jgi:hypothetical protein
MLHQFTDHTGRHWRAETTGVSHEGDGVSSVGVWFVDEATDTRFVGSLNPADVERPTEPRLLDALQATLRDALDDDKPAVMKMQNEPEMFHINHERYVRFVRDPAHEGRAGYMASERLITMDEVALRDELQRLSFDDEQMNAAIALARMMFTGG